MNILRQILIAFALVFVTGANAQLSTLRPISISHLSTANNGSKNSAHIEIQFSAPLDGAKIVRDSENSTPDTSIASTSTSLHAKGLAIEAARAFAKKVTIVHPDFTPCVIDFEKLGFTENIKPGEHYLIKVEVPDLPLVEANRAFSNLDFGMAKTKYDEYIALGDNKDASVANQRLAVIKELETPMKFISEHSEKTDKATLFRCMKAAEMIYDKTHSMKAYSLYKSFRESLYGNEVKNIAMDDGVTELHIDTAYLKPGDNRPMSDNKLPHVDGAPYYSWIIVKVNLNDVVFTGGDQFIDAERVDGDYRLYVPKGQRAAEEIVMYQADCAPLPLSLKDFGIDEIKPASVYVVEIMTPSAAIIEADRAFGNLDFSKAQILYAEILNSADKYDDHSVSLAASRMEDVSPLLNNDIQARWNNLRKDISLKNGPIERDQLSKKCLELAAISEQLDSKRVPGMKRNALTYKELAREYKTAVFLTIHAKALNSQGEVTLGKDGNHMVYKGKSIVLVFDKIGDRKNVEVMMEATSEGVFKKYLPQNVSEWLINHQGKSLKATPKQYVWNGKNLKLERIGKDFEIGLEDGNRSFSITLFLQNKAK